MSRRALTSVCLAALVVGAAASGFATSWLLPRLGAADGPVELRDPGLAALADLEMAFAKTVDMLQPSVVSIVTSSRHGKSYVRELGSGIIVNGAGHILTNNHVISEGNRYVIELHDGRKLNGKLIGGDPKSDLAVLRINAKGLIPARLGDSDKARVGQWVLAMGTPHELARTVTAGIISAKGRRNVGLASYENYIQTDAAINQGNSGGPLVNLRGEVVAINTAILSPRSGSQGISFAIPVNMAKQVMRQLIQKGRVVRGWLGVKVGSLSTLTAQALDYKGKTGIRLTQVIPGSPAEKADLRIDDIAVTMDGRPITDSDRFRLGISQRAPGTFVFLEIWRNGRMKKVRVALADLDIYERRGG